MKKLVSIILLAILIVSLSVTPVFAENTSKISETLQSALDALKDHNYVIVSAEIVDLYDKDAEAEITAKAAEKCGYTLATAPDIDAQIKYLEVYNELLIEFYQIANKQIFDGLYITEDEILYSNKTEYRFRITKAKVNEIALSDDVLSLDLFGDFIPPDPEHLYEARFLEKYYYNSYYPTFPYFPIDWNAYIYDELEYHYDSNNEIDWVLIKARTDWPTPSMDYAVLGDRVWIGGGGSFSIGYCIYDVKRDEFLSICNIYWKQYDGLEEAIDKQEIGMPIGDADLNSELSIFDATYIQRALAQLCEFKYEDHIEDYLVHSYGELKYISDINRDGERSILDATCVQMRIAGLEIETSYEELVFNDYSSADYPDGPAQIPQDSTEISFNVMLDEISSMAPYYYYHSDERASIIKSFFQYKRLFGSYTNLFNDEFFEHSYLVAVTTYVNGDDSIARVKELRKAGNTLYIVMEEVDSGAQDRKLPYYSFVSVEREELKNIDNIVWVK